MGSVVELSRRCLLVHPEHSAGNLLNYRDAARLIGACFTSPPLGLLTVAAMLPPEWDVRLVDENVARLRDEDLRWAQLVLTGGMLPQQPSTLAVVARAQRLGKPVVVGGVDPTTQPDVYAHAEYRVLGEAEVAMLGFLAALARGEARGTFVASRRAAPDEMVVPRFDLIRFDDYVRVDVQFSRGCPHSCEFCAVVELFGRRPRSLSPESLLVVLQHLYDLGYRGHVNLLDDNFTTSRKAAVPMLRALRTWSEQRGFPYYFSTDASLNLASDAELLGLMRENDFRFVFLGIESADAEALKRTGKTHNTAVDAREALRKINVHGMAIAAGFILGLDGESPQNAGEVAALIEHAGICLPYPGLLTALPRTRLCRRLRAEGRLFGGADIIWPEAGGDHTIHGLNFVTDRPRAGILRDYLDLVRGLYAPQPWFARVRMSVDSIRPAYRHRPGVHRSARLALGFVRLSARVGFRRATARPYWSTLAYTLARKPQMFGFAVSMAAMYMKFAAMTRRIVPDLERQAAEVEAVGEDPFNRARLQENAPCGGHPAR